MTRDTLDLRIDKEKIVPALKGNMDEWFGQLFAITNVFACDGDGGRVSNWIGNAELVRVQVGTPNGGSGSGQVYHRKDFNRFKEGYCVRYPEDLIGEMVIGVYTRAHGEALIGLIPVNLYKI